MSTFASEGANIGCFLVDDCENLEHFLGFDKDDGAKIPMVLRDDSLLITFLQTRRDQKGVLINVLSAPFFLHVNCLSF